MKLQYFPDTDTLYIDLLDKPAAASDEIANDVVVDYDADGAVVGIGIDLASTKVDLAKIEVSDLPNVHVLSATRPTLETASVEAQAI